jgi:hypothetical protein
VKKKKVIRIRNSKLRKIRTELRTLLVREAGKRIIQKIHEQRNLRRSDEFGSEKYRKTYNQEIQIRKLLKASICSCATCSDMEKDHVFVPKTQEWYCEVCLERLEKANYFQMVDNLENYE